MPIKEELKKIHQRYGRRIDVLLRKKNYDAARAVIDEAEVEAAGPQDVDMLKDLHLGDVPGITEETQDLFDSIGVYHVLELADVDLEKALALPSMEVKHIQQACQAVIRYGMKRDAERAALVLKVHG